MVGRSARALGGRRINLESADQEVLMSALKKLMARDIASPAGPRDRAALAKLEAFGLHDDVRERWPKERVFT